MSEYSLREVLERVVLTYQTFPFQYRDAKLILPYLDPRTLFNLVREGYLNRERLVCPECGRPHHGQTYTVTKKALRMVMC